MRRVLLPAGWFLMGSLLWWGCSQMEILHHLSEAEANHVVALLQQQGIEATKQPDNPEQNTWKVRVPKPDTRRAWVILQEYKLPKNPERRFADVFGMNKLIVTPMEERALFLEALQGEIAHTLESLDGVIDARVHLVLPERDLTGAPVGRAKASVVVEYQPQARGNLPLTRAEVQQIVAHAVDGMQPAAVAVVMKPVSMTAPLKPEAGAMELVVVGPLVLERRSLPALKAAVAVVALVFILLGILLFWQGRLINRLRMDLNAAQRKYGSVSPARRTPSQPTGTP